MEIFQKTGVPLSVPQPESQVIFQGTCALVKWQYRSTMRVVFGGAAERKKQNEMKQGLSPHSLTCKVLPSQSSGQKKGFYQSFSFQCLLYRDKGGKAPFITSLYVIIQVFTSVPICLVLFTFLLLFSILFVICGRDHLQSNALPVREIVCKDLAPFWLETLQKLFLNKYICKKCFIIICKYFKCYHYMPKCYQSLHINNIHFVISYISLQFCDYMF